MTAATPIRSTATVLARLRAARARPRPVAAGLIYRPGTACSACGCGQFDVRTLTAECARCGAALLVSTPSQEGLPE